MSIPKPPSPGEEGFMMHCRASKLFPFREYRYSLDRRFRFDFAWPEWLLAVEIEGGTRNGKSRHTRHDGFEQDNEKYNEAALLGWKVLRFTTSQVKSGLAIDTVLRALGKPPR